MSVPARRVALVLAAVIVLGSAAACAGTGPSPSAAARTPLSVGLGYIPSVQFAPFYLADQAGYYRDAGLDVTFDHRIDPELITLIGQGQVDIGMGDGTSVIPAVSRDVPVRYVATIYARFPNVVLAKGSSGIEEPADLEGRRLGTPGRFGSGWIMLQALLASAGLSPDDLEIVTYPDFGQAVALAEDQVDAATGFVNNEPVRLELAGTPTSVLRVDGITPLPGPGLVVGTETLRTREAPLRAFVAATLRAMEEIIADPQRGVDAAVARVPELGEEPEAQRAILDATIVTWQRDGEDVPLGAIDRDAWAESVEFMRGLPETPVARDVPVEELVDERLLPEG